MGGRSSKAEDENDGGSGGSAVCLCPPQFGGYSHQSQSHSINNPNRTSSSSGNSINPSTSSSSPFSCPIHPNKRFSSTQIAPSKQKISPYILSRWSSEYLDEDGDVANEFYEEVPGRKSKSRQSSLIRIINNLQPLGWVDYDIPRLNCDLPYIMFEATVDSFINFNRHDPNQR